MVSAGGFPRHAPVLFQGQAHGRVAQVDQNSMAMCQTFHCRKTCRWSCGD